ncbi:hypothetical protein HanPI659440_Chr17g0686681 [Helianthus annuus]|nr:hypothetical protein HanPI659440_Chr17g0686681 [Helianthus annuus]
MWITSFLQLSSNSLAFNDGCLVGYFSKSPINRFMSMDYYLYKTYYRRETKSCQSRTLCY